MTDVIEAKAKNLPQVEQEMLKEITNFKQQTIQYLKVQSSRLNVMDVKEVKDLVSIVNTLETSLKPEGNKDQKPINVVIQNLINQYND